MYWVNIVTQPILGSTTVCDCCKWPCLNHLNGSIIIRSQNPCSGTNKYWFLQTSGSIVLVGHHGDLARPSLFVFLKALKCSIHPGCVRAPISWFHQVHEAEDWPCGPTDLGRLLTSQQLKRIQINRHVKLECQFPSIFLCMKYGFLVAHLCFIAFN